MNLPIGLEQALIEGKQRMASHPQHVLQPFHRRTIYRKIGSGKSRSTYRVRVTLDVLSIRWLLSTWQSGELEHDWPMLPLLKTIEDTLDGKVSQEMAFAKASDAQVLLERLDSPGASARAEPRFRTLCAYNAVLDALFDASGSCQFDKVIITKRTLDSDVDPWSTDVAMWVSYAYAAAPWDESSSSTERMHFWEWWLDDAIPAAWEAAHASDSGH